MRTFSSLIFVSLSAVMATTVNAQIAGIPSGVTQGLSSDCLAGMASLLTNAQLNDCLKTSNAIAALGGLDENQSVIPAVDAYIANDLCPANVCSIGTLSSARQTVSQACSSDIDNGQNFLPSLLEFVLKDYPQIKRAACLRDSKAHNQVCVSQILTGIQDDAGQALSLNALQQLNNNHDAVLQNIQHESQNTTAWCTDCNRGVLSFMAPFLGDFLDQSTVNQLQQSYSQACGANFVPNKIPSSLKDVGRLDFKDNAAAALFNNMHGAIVTLIATVFALGLSTLL